MATFVNINSENFGSQRRQRPAVATPFIIEISDSSDEQMDDVIDDNGDFEYSENVFDEEENNDEINDIDNTTEEYWSRIPLVPVLSARNFYICISNEETCDNYLMSEGVFYSEDHVILCEGGSRMYLENGARGLRWRCNGIRDSFGDRCCRGSERSARFSSFFFGRKISRADCLAIIYYWVHKIRKMTIASLVGVSPNSVRTFLADWYQMLQEDLKTEDMKIGGEGIIVQIDESKFGKRKHNRGHRVEGVWVVGGVELTPQRKCFLITVPNRNQMTLAAIIEKYVNHGSIVHTDCWAAYNYMTSLGMNLTHETVNHSVTFRDGDVHTNHIEGTWNGIKINLSPALRTKKMVPWALVEFIWRRKHFGDLWGGVMKCLREVQFSRHNVNVPFHTEMASGEDIESVEQSEAESIHENLTADNIFTASEYESTDSEYDA